MPNSTEMIPRADESATASPPQTAQKATSWSGMLLAALGAVASLLYLANPGFGLAEILPDGLPGVGNIDEFLFSLLLVFCLQKLGVNLPFFPRNTPRLIEKPRE
jgi:hypothetical protein